jgi:hypothetical protein
LLRLAADRITALWVCRDREEAAEALARAA